jgi:hypothetical protein
MKYFLRVMARSKLLAHGCIVIGYLVLALLMTYPVAWHIGTHILAAQQMPTLAPDDRDPWHSLWVLWFTKHSLFELGQLPFSTDLLFYPRGTDLAYLGFIIFSVLLALPFVQLFGLITAYNLLILFSLTAAGYTGFLLVRYLTQDQRAAFVAGMVFAFSPFHMVRASEQLFILMSAAWIPLYGLLLLQGLWEGKTVSLILASVVFLVTIFANPYYAMFLLAFTGIIVVLQLWRPGSRVARGALMRRTGLLMTLNGLWLLPLIAIVHFNDWTDILLYRPFYETVALSADLLAFFIPSPYHPVLGSLVKPFYESFSGNLFEQTVSIGYMTLTVAVVAVLKGLKAETWLWSLATLIFFVLCLGPLLHIAGQSVFTIDPRTSITFPLPSLVLHFLPIVGAARAPSRFAVMLMLCLAVLVGYGVKVILRHCEQKQGRSWVSKALLAVVSGGIIFEYLSAPFPLQDARIPQIYADIGQAWKSKGSLLELPLNWLIAKYQYYQTAHGMRLLTGFGPRPHPALEEYAEIFPLIRMLKNPERLLDLREPWDRLDVLRLVDRFAIDVVMIHREYLDARVVEPLKAFVQRNFPVREVLEDGNLIMMRTTRGQGDATHWRPQDYRWDFELTDSQPFIFEGWSIPEQWAQMTVAWSSAKESRLWVYFPRQEDVTMEFRVLPFTLTDSPSQAIKIYLNRRFLQEVPLYANGWQTFTLTLPRAYLQAGINEVSFAYRYMVTPAKVFAHEGDSRTLAVAYDFIAFRPQ